MMEASGGLIPTKLNGDLVVLIGAGASSYLGLPGLNDLLQNPERGIGLKINDPVYTTMYRVWRIVESSRPGQANFEELITRLKTYYQTALLMREDDVFASHLGSVPHSVTTREFESVWWLALTACYRQLLDKFSPQCIDPNTAEFHVSIELLERLIRFNSLQAIHVYTTNYDCAPNLMASKAERLAFVSHIDNHSGHFRENWYFVRKDLGNADGRPLLYLHRLHGCVAWIADQNCPFHLREIYGAGGKLEIAHESDLHKICIKLTSSERIGTNPAFLLAFTEFAEHLRSCGLLLVWGYSFRDVEVLRAINQALTSRASDLPILYVDPYMSEAVALEHIRDTLGAFPVEISGHLRPKQVNWVPQDGPKALIDRTLEAVDRAMKAKDGVGA